MSRSLIAVIAQQTVDRTRARHRLLNCIGELDGSSPESPAKDKFKVVD